MPPTTTNDVEVRLYIQRWRDELTAAAKILKGENLESFRQMVADIANLVGIDVTDTGTFTKADLPETASEKQVPADPREHARSFSPKGWKPRG